MEPRVRAFDEQVVDVFAIRLLTESTSCGGCPLYVCAIIISADAVIHSQFIVGKVKGIVGVVYDVVQCPMPALSAQGARPLPIVHGFSACFDALAAE
jgi:hypothetical protein